MINQPNPVRRVIKTTGMADLSQLGAAAEDLNEETLQEEELGGAADIAAANKTDDEKLTEAGLVAALTVVTDIITDDMKHDLAGRETPVTDEEKAGAA